MPSGPGTVSACGDQARNRSGRPRPSITGTQMRKPSPDNASMTGCGSISVRMGRNAETVCTWRSWPIASSAWPAARRAAPTLA